MKENEYQSKLIKKIEKLLPGCLILKNDSNYIQGIPDLSIFYNRHWAMLEVKRNHRAKIQPNQTYYISATNKMSFARFIFPENEEKVLEELIRFMNG